MLDTLQKMSGTTHRVRNDSKTITRDAEKLLLQNEGKVSYTMNAKEEPVITYNDMAFITDRNSIVFRAGDSPIWNRNETVMPMSWRLFQNTIVKPGKKFTLQTIPTLSSAVDFDVRKNQPDFAKMLDKRMNQAYESEGCQDMYKAVYDYSDYDIEQLDPDNYADEIMDIINRSISNQKAQSEAPQDYYDEEEEYDDYMDETESYFNKAETNTEQLQENTKYQQQMQAKQEKIYAGGMLSKDDLIGMSGVAHQFDKDIIAVYVEIKGDMQQDSDYFTTRSDGTLCGLNGEPYIIKLTQSADLQRLNNAAKSEDENVFAEDDIDQSDLSALGSYQVTDAFYRFLVSLPEWHFAKDKFERGMQRRMSM